MAGSDSLHARMIGYEPQAQLVELAGQSLIVDLTKTARGTVGDGGDRVR
jgi:hypothetical protein